MRKVSGKNAGKPALEFFQRGFLNLRGTDESQTAGSNPRTGRKKKIVRAASVLACIVAFTTTYALILPAVTLERQPVCGQEEHIHTDACYAYLDANGATVDPAEVAALSAAGDPDTDAESTEATLFSGSRGGYFEGVESNVKTEMGADGIADDSRAADQAGDRVADVSVEASTESPGNPTQGLFELTDGDDSPVAVQAGDAGATSDMNAAKSEASDADAADDVREARADAGDSNAVNAANAGSVNSAMMNSGTSLEVGGKSDMVRTNDTPADAADTANAGSAVDAVTDPADTPMPAAGTDAENEKPDATGNPVTDSAALAENAGTDASSPENPETTGTPDATENPAADGSESPETDSESETTTPSVADTAQSVRRVLICGQEEHQHTVECYPSKSESNSSGFLKKISPKSVLTGLFGYDHSQSVTVDRTTITAEYNDGILPDDVTMQAVPVSADAYVGAVAGANVSQPDIDSSKSYLIYGIDFDNRFYVLKTDGATSSYDKLSDLDSLGDQYKWKIEDRGTNNGNPVVQFRPIGENARALNIYSNRIGVNTESQEIVLHASNIPGCEGAYTMEAKGRDNWYLAFWNGFTGIQDLTGGTLAMPVYIYEQGEPTKWKYNVSSNNSDWGAVNGQPSFTEEVNGQNRNASDITAVPTPKSEGSTDSSYLFDHWEATNATLTEEQKKSGTLPAGTVTFTGDGGSLKAVFVYNDNKKGDDGKEGRVVDKGYLDSWLKDLEQREFPIDKESTNKTAHVYDYENRIYQVDITTKSNISTFAANLDLGFILDVSGSMQFPSKLNKVNDTVINVRRLNDDSNTRNWLDKSKTYYFKSDETGSATVYKLFYNNSVKDKGFEGRWEFTDASWDQHNRMGWDSSFTNDQGNNSDCPSRTYQIYTDGEPGKKRLTYLESSLSATVKDLENAMDKLSIADDSEKSPVVGIAWNTFAYDAFKGSDEFLSVKDNADKIKPNYTTQSDTATDEALLDAIDFNWISGDTKYAILITDGAPQKDGVDATQLNTDVEEAARKLKAKGVTLITVGLSMADVERGSTLLNNIASTDTNGNPYFYRADSGDELEYIIREIVRQIMVNAITVGDVTDKIDPVFYPVDENGNTLEDGARINMDGTLWDAARDAEKTYGTIHKSGDTYTVDWPDQDITWDGWKGSVLVKAKEDFLGGNTMSTNKDASITPRGYKVKSDGEVIDFVKPEDTEDGTKKNLTATIELDTPSVNVDELQFNEHDTSVTVKKGESVSSLQAVKNLFDRIDVSEVVTLSDSAHRNIGSEDPDRENPETFKLKDVADQLTNDQWKQLLDKSKSSDERKIQIPYGAYGHENVGWIEITLEEILKGSEKGAGYEAREGKTSHETSEEGEAVEFYTLAVTYIPTPAKPDKAIVGDVAGAIDYHTTPGRQKGQATDTIVSNNTHVVNVGDVDIPVEKTWDGNKALLDASASVKLTLGRYKLVEDTEGGTGTIILGKSLDGISRSDFDATYTITGPDGSSQTYSFKDLTKMISGLALGEYTITETNATAPQEGYQADHGNQTRIVTVEKDKTTRVVFSGTYTEKPGTLKITHDFLGELPSMPEGFAATYTITAPDGTTTTVDYPAADQTNLTPGTYVVVETITDQGAIGDLGVVHENRQEVEVPRGGEGVATFSTTYSSGPGDLKVQHLWKVIDDNSVEMDLPKPSGWAAAYSATGSGTVTFDANGNAEDVTAGKYTVMETITNWGDIPGYERITTETTSSTEVSVPSKGEGTATFTTYYKEKPGTLKIAHIFDGDLKSMPKGWVATYKVKFPDGTERDYIYSQISAGIPNLKAGTYEVTETITNDGNHDGYTLSETGYSSASTPKSKTIQVEVPKGGTNAQPDGFTSNYESEKKVVISVLSGKYNLDNVTPSKYTISEGSTVTVIVKSSDTLKVKRWDSNVNGKNPDNGNSYFQNEAEEVSGQKQADGSYVYTFNNITANTWVGVLSNSNDDPNVIVKSGNTELTPNMNKAPVRPLLSLYNSLPQSNDLPKSLSMLAAGSPSSPNANPSDANDQAVSTDTFTGISLALAQTSPTLPAAPAGMKYVLDDSYEGAEATLDASKDWKDVIKDQDWANDLGDYIYFIAAVDESNMPVGTTSSIVNETAQNAETVNTLTVTNILPSVGNLKIEKHVTGTNTADKEFTFTITLQAPEGMTFAEKYPAKKNGLATSAASLNRTEDKTQATVTVTLKADETYEIDQFPEGTTYSVTETRLPAGYTEASHQGNSGSITRDSTVTATMNNTYHAEGDVIFKAKKIFTNGILGTPDFTFRLTQVTGDQSETQATEKVILASPATASTTATSGITQIVDITFAVDSTHAETGEYWFMLEEVLPEDLDNDNISGNIKYDTHKKWIKVTVTDDGEGHLVVTKDPSVEEGTADDTWTNEQLTSLKVDKVWSNDDDATTIQVRGVARNANGDALQTTDYVTLDGSEQSAWTYTWNKLPKSVDGQAVTWVVEEKPIDGFADPAIVEITGSDKTDGVDSEYEIINTKSTVEKMETSISVIKKWDGITDDTKNAVTVKLQRAHVRTTDPLVTVTVNGVSRSTYVNKGGSITYTLTGKHGDQNYVVTTTTGTISDDQIEVERGLYPDKEMPNYLTIKNITENLAVTIAPNVNQTILATSGTLRDYDRPTHFDASNLTDSDYADYPSGTDVKTATLSNENGWSAVFDKLPFRGGTDSDTFYVYRVKETTVLDGYVTEYIPEAGMYSGTIVVNNKSETVSISGTKTWIDKTQNHDNAHDVSLTLKRTTEPVSETSEWETVAGVSPVWDSNTYTFTDLPKYNDEKKEYVYKAEESSVNVDGKIYTSSANGNDFTNTEAVNIEATKTWKQGKEAVNTTITNASAKFELQRKSGENWIKVEQSGLNNPVTMSVENAADAKAWKAVWNNLPKYELAGGEVTEIQYRVVEKSATVLGDNVKPNDAPTANVTEGRANIDNTLPEIDMSVTKQWKDDSGVAREFDEDKSIGFTLYQKAGTSVAVIYTSYGTEGKGTVTYDKVAKKWQKITISGLPKYAYDTTAKAWVKAAYFVVEDSASDVAVTYKRGEEEAVNGAGNASVTGDSSNKTITIINQDCVTSIKIVKVDKDDNTVHLEGASFELYKKQEKIYVKYLKNAFPESPYERSSELTIEDKDDGITFTGLTDGDYQIKETKSPGGYVLTEDVLIEFTVTEGVVTDKSGNKPFVVQYDETKEADPATYTISNEKGAALPSTGGSGTALFTVLGSILVMLSGVGLILWRRRRFMGTR